jgi:capsular exopolysaccharide synthesis family protein
MNTQSRVELSQTSNTNELDLGHLFKILWQGKRIIAFVIFLCVTMAGIYGFKIAKPLYVSTTVLMLETEQQQVVDLQSVVAGVSGETIALNSEVEVLKSRALIGKVVDNENLVDDPYFNPYLNAPSLKSQVKAAIGLSKKNVPLSDAEEAAMHRIAAIDTFFSHLAVRNIAETFIFNIIVSADTPKKSARLADSVAQQYILNQVDVKFEASQTATIWLSDRVKELQNELLLAEKKASDFRSNSAWVSDVAIEQLDRQIKDLRDRASAEEDVFNQALAYAQMLKSLEGKPRKTIADAVGNRTLTATLSNENERARNIQFDTLFSRLQWDADRNTDQVQVRLNNMRESIERFDTQIADQNADQIILQQLTREAEAAGTLYEYFLNRLKETSAQQGLHSADSRIISAAVAPSYAASPRKSVLLAMAFILGTVFGSAIVVLKEMRNDTVSTSLELQRATNQIVLGQLPNARNESRSDLFKVMENQPLSALAETLRNLRTSLMMTMSNDSDQIIMLSSSQPEEGKTTITLCLALSLSSQGKKVLVIEGDLRRPTFDQVLNKEHDKGLYSVLTERTELEESIIHYSSTGPDILMSGKIDAYAPDIFSSDKFEIFLNSMRKKYDFILIDTPPVLLAPETRIMAHYADKVFFVVRAGVTSTKKVNTALDMLELSGHPAKELILNRVNLSDFKRDGFYSTKYYENF